MRARFSQPFTCRIIQGELLELNNSFGIFGLVLYFFCILKGIFATLSSAEAFGMVFKKPRKRGKGGKKGKTGKAEKAREKGKSEESLCQISVEIWQKLSISDRTQPDCRLSSS